MQNSSFLIDFESIEWEFNLGGIRSKTAVDGASQIRILEFGRDLDHPDWCIKGHIGYVDEGRFEIEFDETTVMFRKGDGIRIPAGEKYRHRPKANSDLTRLIFFELV